MKNTAIQVLRDTTDSFGDKTRIIALICLDTGKAIETRRYVYHEGYHVPLVETLKEFKDDIVMFIAKQ
jgi:hypothetical protein